MAAIVQTLAAVFVAALWWMRYDGNSTASLLLYPIIITLILRQQFPYSAYISPYVATNFKLTFTNLAMDV